VSCEGELHSDLRGGTARPAHVPQSVAARQVRPHRPERRHPDLCHLPGQTTVDASDLCHLPGQSTVDASDLCHLPGQTPVAERVPPGYFMVLDMSLFEVIEMD